MSQTARAESLPSAAISSYLASAMSRIDKVIATTTLVEPRVADLDRAARLMGPLVETLAALAMGTIVGGMAHAVRRSLGSEVTAEVAAMLAKTVATYAPRPIPALSVLDTSPSRSFREELAKRLRLRIAVIAGDVRAMLMSIAEIVARCGPNDAHAFDRVIGACAADNIVDDKYMRDLQRGWSAWSAVVTNTSDAESTALWTLWTRRVRGEREVLTPSTADVVAAGFIARIG